ncbi:NrfD/PsrC family molybdoenzyme membrane anchor subunit [Adlercreutzia murintestinalis]|uniref:NrfD/PsrC family molybdoenzyme membrane anchor subunit n=1 Tax=Adlercreutzia murintestinalis TaxID=2941325 RepID=UPI00203B98D4|nr:NrfD/PsrC family molybdoenzyme membrane anchor subunit [Adlercreutzia murintestinalis]
MRHHFWKWPIPVYLFLGGLGGGIFCLAAILTLFVFPGVEAVPQALAWPGFISILCLGFGCLMLVADLGQPMVFYRAFVKSTSVLAWGARLLTVCMIFGLLWFVSYIPWEWFRPIADFFVFFRPLNIAIAGIAGTCIMLYTGIFLSTLKAHAFWATPALPVLFTISALSTACAAIALSIGWWPADTSIQSAAGLAVLEYSAEASHILHLVDVILVVCEIVVLLVMVLSFLGAGNKTANKVGHKWVHGSYALAFWGGMMVMGLGLPEFMYIFMDGTVASTTIAPILVLCGGCLLRFMVVNSDERAPLPGEDQFFEKLPPRDAEFITKWTYGENIY